MTPAEKIRRAAAVPILLAEEELRAGVADDRVYDAVLAATGSAEKASEALTRRVAERHRRGERAEI